MAPDTTVRCPRCRATRRVSFLAACTVAWPRCCDDAMLLEATTEAVEVAVAGVWAEAATPVGRLRRIEARAN